MACTSTQVDDEFANLLQQIFSHVSNTDDSEQDLFNLWTEKLLSEGDSKESCKIRNNYANFLLYVLENDNLVLPFSKAPPQGPLPELQDLLHQLEANGEGSREADCIESTHSIMIENLRVSALPDEEVAVGEKAEGNDEELCREVEALGLSIDVFEFVKSISKHTKDKGKKLRMVLDEELGHFNVYVGETFDIKNKDYGELMARLQCQMKEQYTNWTQRVLHHTKKNNQWLLENIPDFDWNQHRKDPNYMDMLFRGTFKGEPVVIEMSTQEGDDVSKWRNQNFHKLIWLRDRIKKVQETNDTLRSKLEDLQRQTTMSGQSKKLLNETSTCVDELLLGFTRAHPGLRLDTESRVVSLHSWEHSKTALISGGGSGHEPFAAGFVGEGMLTAAVAGSVFTSPPSGSIVAAIRSVTKQERNSALVVVPNYTGDCLNFGLAVEKVRSEGFEIDVVVVGEDCALSERRAGCRGMCGLLFVYKICGSMSETGKPLADLVSTAKLIVSSMATIGVGLSACSLPGSSKPLFSLAADKMELGLGVHGEAGSATIKLCSTAEAVSQMLVYLFAKLQLDKGDEVAVLINNLGGSSQLEQWVFVAETEKQLLEAGIVARRIYAGHLMTSLETPGFQISLLKLILTTRNDWLVCLDAKTDAPSWPGGKYSYANKALHQKRDFQHKELKDTRSGVNCFSAEALGSFNTTQMCLLAAAKALGSSEQKLNLLDSGCGDGDCGSTLCRFAEGVLQRLAVLNTSKPSVMLQELAEISEACMGGTSGAIYSLLFTTSGAAMSQEGCEGDWALAWEHGLDGIMKYSKARIGDRTMLDALIPACKQFKNHPRQDSKECLYALGKAVEAAQIGCMETRAMSASVGRASYVSVEHVTDVDAGAYGVTIWLHAIYQSLMEMSQKCETQV